MRTRTIASEDPANTRVTFRRLLLTVLTAAAVATLLVVSLAGQASADDDDDDDGGEYAAGEIVVKLVPGNDIGYINDKYGTTTLDVLSGQLVYLLGTPGGEAPDDLAARIQSTEVGIVLYAEPNFTTGLPEASRAHKARPGGEPDPSGTRYQYRNQYAVGATAMNLSAAHGVSKGAGAVVAVVDTGVQVSHEAFSGKLTRARYDFVDDDGVPADKGNGKDDDGDGEKDETVGHGTHVAGIVALTAPRAKIMPLRALDSEGRGTSFDVARAIAYALDHGADVVNLSLGTSQQTDLLEDVVEEDDDDAGEEGGAVVVAAAGNDADNRPQYPAAESGAVAVTSVDGERKWSEFANYSADPYPGGWIDIAAPGSGIYGPFPKDRYAKWDGTSMATPFVAGQAALIHSADSARWINPACVTDVIGSSAQPLPSQEYSGMLGSGHADAGASVTMVRANPCLTGDGDDDD